MKNVLMSIAILMLVCCDEAEATSKKNITNKVIKPSVKMPETPKATTEYTTVVEEPVTVFLDELTFEEAFALEHRAKGEGNTFWWRGSEYTTNLVVLDKFVLEHAFAGGEHLNWVTNNKDLDDNCKSNLLDDCGVCDGPGKTTWFRDKDGDGLGALTGWITSCTYPEIVEIESLQEGGGDQGVMGE